MMTGRQQLSPQASHNEPQVKPETETHNFTEYQTRCAKSCDIQHTASSLKMKAHHGREKHGKSRHDTKIPRD